MIVRINESPSRLTSLPVLTARQQCFFFFFVQHIFQEDVHRDMLVPFCCQPTPQPHNYSSLWMTTYQENWISHFVSEYIQTEWLLWLDSFLVSLLRSKRSVLNVSLHPVSSIEKCWLVEICHLNLMFCRVWLKSSPTLKYTHLTHVCLGSSVRRCMLSTHISYTQKWDGFLKVDHWPGFLSYESCSQDVF